MGSNRMRGEEKIVNLEKVFNPRSVAIIGVSSNPRKLGYQCLKALLTDGYQGKIYPIHPQLKELMGIKVYNSLDEIRDSVDLAIIAVSAPKVPAVLKECIKKNIKAVIIISSGFKEIGEYGEELEKQLREIADKHDICIVGPNCLGAANLKANLNATFFPSFVKVKSGDISLISQSGGITGTLLYHAADLGVGIAKFISIGNRCNMDFADYIQYFYKDHETKVIGMFLEGTEDARRMYEVAKKVTKVKPILVYKAGKTETGIKGVKSHTGSLAGKTELYSAAFKQAGIIEVKSIRELIEAAKALSIVKYPPKNNRVAIITHTAGPSIVATDILEKEGIKLAKLSEETIRKIQSIMPFPIPITNPVDTLGFGYALPELYGKIAEQILADNSVDLLLAIYSPSFQDEIRTPAKELIEATKRREKQIIVSFNSPLIRKPKDVEALERNGIPVFFDPESAARATAKLVKYYTEVKSSEKNHQYTF